VKENWSDITDIEADIRAVFSSLSSVISSRLTTAFSETGSMNRQKVIAILVCVIGFGGIASAAYVQSTIASYEYAVPCFKLGGVPGLLQSAHFIGTGGCNVDYTKPSGCDNKTCVIQHPPSGADTTGQCFPFRLGSQIKNCVCVPDATDQ
jgi:hypothetical protein